MATSSQSTPATIRKDGIRVTTYAGPGAEPEMHTVPWPKVPPRLERRHRWRQ